MRNLLYGVIWLAILLPAATASASVIYNFGGGSDNSATRLVTVDGLAVQVSGYDTDYDAISNSGTLANINRHSNGWGIQTDPADNRMGLDEALVFDWASKTVTLLSSMIFERGGAPIEIFDLYIDGILALDDVQVLPDNSGSNTVVSLDMSGFALSGSRFAFVGQTPRTGGDLNQGIRIKQLEVSVVPEPSILMLMSISLIGLGLVRRNTVAR